MRNMGKGREKRDRKREGEKKTRERKKYCRGIKDREKLRENERERKERKETCVRLRVHVFQSETCSLNVRGEYFRT